MFFTWSGHLKRHLLSYDSLWPIIGILTLSEAYFSSSSWVWTNQSHWLVSTIPWLGVNVLLCIYFGCLWTSYIKPWLFYHRAQAPVDEGAWFQESSVAISDVIAYLEHVRWTVNLVNERGCFWTLERPRSVNWCQCCIYCCIAWGIC